MAVLSVQNYLHGVSMAAWYELRVVSSILSLQNIVQSHKRSTANFKSNYLHLRFPSRQSPVPVDNQHCDDDNDEDRPHIAYISPPYLSVTSSSLIVAYGQLMLPKSIVCFHHRTNSHTGHLKEAATIRAIARDCNIKAGTYTLNWKVSPR